jgi:hypothetical protein
VSTEWKTLLVLFAVVLTASNFHGFSSTVLSCRPVHPGRIRNDGWDEDDDHYDGWDEEDDHDGDHDDGWDEEDDHEDERDDDDDEEFAAEED